MESDPPPAPAGTAPPSHTSEPVDVSFTPLSLHRAVYARRAEFTRPHQIRLKIGTWNVAACPGTDQDLASWFVLGGGLDRRLTSASGSISGTTSSTVNSALEPETPNDSFAEWSAGDIRLVGGGKIGLYVLGLQEVVDINGASPYMTRPTAVLEKWKTAVQDALPDGYALVVSEQMTGLLLLIYASPEVLPMLSHVSTSAVGTGLLGRLGNKGAVSAKIVLGEATSLVFINSHLSSGHEPYYLDRRCWDIAQIETRTQFAPYNHPGAPETTEPDRLGDEDAAFWFGDLNFRLDGLPGDDIRRILTLHSRGEYGNRPDSAGNPDEPLDGEDVVILKDHESSDTQSSRDSAMSAASPKSSVTETDADCTATAPDEFKQLPPLPDPEDFLPDTADDPASLQATLNSLLPHDQLKMVMKERRALQDGWREGRISFLPSYKYDVGSVGLFDSSEKRRPPSWCDRILYRSRKNREEWEQRVRDEEETQKKDAEMKARGLDQSTDEDEVLFECDVEPDGDDQLPQPQQPQPQPQPSSSGFIEYDEYDEADDNAPTEQDGADGLEEIDDRIHLDIYTSHQRISSSDHKPVVSVFTLDYDAVVPELKARVHAEVAKELDRAENEGRPAVTIVADSRYSANARDPSSDGAVEFGSVEFSRRAVASLTIASTGRVPAEFSFVEKPAPESPEHPPYQWLTTSFIHHEGGVAGRGEDLGKTVVLEPGETVNVLLEVFVDDLPFTRLLNDGAVTLDDVLVLRVVDGRDHFIPVRGIWAPTCIGRSTDELIRVPDGGLRPFITAISRKKNGSATIAGGSVPYDMEVYRSSPKELFRLTEHIENLTDRVIADEQMLAECKIPTDKPGWPFEDLSQPPDPDQVAGVVSALDNDLPVIDTFAPEVCSLTRLEVVCHVFLLFLQGLTDGIVTVPLWSRIDQSPLLAVSGARVSSPGGRDPNSENDKTIILDILASAPYHNISFVFLTASLSRVIGELSPLSLSNLDTLRAISRSSVGGFGAFGRRSLSNFRRGSVSVTTALDALERRQARERRVAAVFGPVICRAPPVARERDRRTMQEKQNAVVELFLRRSREELG